METAKRAQKKLELLVKLQDCLDSQLCRELETLERHRQAGNAEKDGGTIKIPRKSPLVNYIPRKEKNSASSEEVRDALSAIDSSIIDLAKENERHEHRR